MQHFGRFLWWLFSAVILAVVGYGVSKFLDAQIKAGHDVGWVGRLMVSFPAQLWIIALALVLGLLYVCWPTVSKLRLHPEPAPFVATELTQAIRERDEARSRIAELEAEISKEFPDFKALILEWQTPDPPEISPDLHTAFIVSMSNFGAPSAVVSYKVSALFPSGMQVDAEIFQTDRLAFTMENGTVQVDYNQSDYIMNRTMAPVVRGTALIGVLPVVFRGIKDLREVDMRTFRVSFSDGTGTRDRKAKWWTTEPIQAAQDKKAFPHKRPTLSPLTPVSKPPPGRPV